MVTTRLETRIKVEQPSNEMLTSRHILNWPIWTKEPSTFEWDYDSQEICYFLEGDVTVTTDQGETAFGKGDLVTFPRGLHCTWHVKKAVRKHYHFE